MRIVALSLLVVVIGCYSIAPAAELEPIAETIANIEKSLSRDRRLINTGRVMPLWLVDGKRFLFAANGRGDLSLFMVDPVVNTIQQISNDSEVRSALAIGSDEPNVALEGYDESKSLLLIRAGDMLYEYDPQADSARLAQQHPLDNAQQISNQFPTTFGPLMEAGSPDGKLFVTLKNHNLYIRPAGSDSLRPLTSDGHLKETWLNTQESSQSFNVFWSPESTRIATLQLDARKVWHEPVPHWTVTPPPTEPIPYPRSGEPMHRFRPFIIDVSNGDRVAIELGDTENNYVDILGWRADGQRVYVQVTDREHKDLRFYGVDATSGRSTLLLQERSATYLDTPMLLSPKLFHPLNQGGFLYLTEQSQWRHIQRHDEDGKLVAKLTNGPWPVHEIVAIDQQSGWVYFRASQSKEEPYDLQLFRVSSDGGVPQLLTAGTGVNTIEFAPGRQYFIAQRSSTENPPIVELRHADGRMIRELVKVSADPVLTEGYGGVEPFTANSTDDRWTMHGVIIKPHGFDAQQKYPVIEFIYGGMQARQTPHDYFGPLRTLVVQAMLREAFVVVIVDAPGTPGRGRVFQDATYGIWPQTVIDNHVQWIRKASQTRPWMDLSQVGIYGHSWGGYMAQRGMIDAPDFYKAAASHAAPSDFFDHPYYIEPFMGLPANNQAGYQAGSNLSRVDRIQGPVLSMPEPLDVNAGFSPGMKFVAAMMAARKDVELFSTPESNHSLACCQQSDYLYKVAVITRFFRRHLTGQEHD